MKAKTVTVKTMLTNDQCVVQSGTAVIAEMNGEIVALDAAKGACYGMNPVATRIWKKIAAPRRVADLCTELVAEYDVDPATCRREVLTLLEDLLREGLLEVVPLAGNESSADVPV
jgi:hypothetical protein